MNVRACTSIDELRQARFPIWHYFGAEPTQDDAPRLAKILPPERMHAAWDGAAVVGAAGVYPFDLSLPGGRSIPSAGVTAVGVLPTHRRRGVLAGLMRAQLDDIRDRGEAVAWLWASEATIYGRFGYGLASMAGDVHIDRQRARLLGDGLPIGQARLIPVDEALELFPRVYDRAFAQHPGMFSRSRAWWEHRRLYDDPARRGGAGPLNRVVIEVDGEAVAYAMYRVSQAFENNVSTGTVSVVEALGVTPEATRAIWSFLFGIDWTSRITAAQLPVDHPLLLIAAEPRRLNFNLADALWVRLVDVGRSLSARGYSADEPLVFDVEDEFCPWNQGRWQLADGVASRTDLPADLRLGVDGLGSALLGGFSFRRLADSGRVHELRPGAIASADRVFAVDRAPWCVEIFLSLKRCPACMAPIPACFCAEIPSVPSRIRVVVVRHRSERRKVSNTGVIAARVIGGLVVEHSSAALAEAALGASPFLLFPNGAERAVWPEPSTLVVLDGTWGQARRMRARLPELACLPVLTLPTDGRYTIGVQPRMRERHMPEALSTIEAIAGALHALGDPEPAAALRQLSERMNTLWLGLRGRSAAPRALE